MKIIVAKNAGFCFGVKRAVDMTLEELNISNENIYSYGPLIHNPQAVKSLEDKGLSEIESIEDLRNKRIVIRSHGVSKEIIDKMNHNELSIIDCTCPYVKAVHKKVEEFSTKGYNIVIIGDKTHPEVIGINGWCNDKAYIVNSIEDVMDLQKMDKIYVVSQTTNTYDKFATLSKAIYEKGNEVEINNTICNATKLRQESCAEVASKVDAMIVIGGKISSNTQKLAQISKEYCKNVYHIETIKDLPLQELLKFNTIGVTAGASTPDWIIKEAVEIMDNLYNNEMNNEMMEAIENSFTRIHRGDVLKGKVLFVTNDEVMVNINYRSDGIINRDELSNDPDVKPKDLFKEGDEIQVYVVRLDDGEGNVVLSLKRVEDMKRWDVLEENFKNKTVVDCKVTSIVKGGLTVLVNGVNGFMPASHVSANYVTDLNQFKGRTFKARIIDFDMDKRRVILSRKEVEKEEIASKRKEVWGNLEVNKTVEGVVQRLTDFGAFVDLGGVDGLIHISDLSWSRVKHPSEVVKAGAKVEVVVLALDKDKNRISLGLKQTIEEPWEAFKKNVNINDIVEGKVVNLLDFGAFVRLSDGVDGLLHVSQISKEHISKPSDVLKVGDKVNVKVIEISEEDRRISLSMKDATEEVENKEDEIVNEDINATIEDIVTNRE